MLMTSTTFEIPGHHTVKSLGIVRGLTVRTRSFPVSFLGVLRTLFGGRVEIFAVLCEQAREESFQLMIAHARSLGANAVIGSLAGVDPNPNDALTLSLPAGLTDNALFNLSGGNLQANASFDFEANSSHIVTIRVTDFEGATFDKPLTISVTDVTDYR
jgi:uncharacterized protein YbjQ (UPF0145 family)